MVLRLHYLIKNGSEKIILVLADYIISQIGTLVNTFLLKFFIIFMQVGSNPGVTVVSAGYLCFLSIFVLRIPNGFCRGGGSFPENKAGENRGSREVEVRAEERGVGREEGGE